ncbi:hypothetical protein QBC46DRAFT_391068 [Diplogelasinospora grovesii]|uniref:COP9 signalosome complex subunit 4 n=1 Tax=Diplogelasinospora grovesii TaxID=303347 RepID=A0AAN6N5C7_9PEZI|nr:hypothetical protein QBC46DRAFT_391068 [Diplogelasinospora grovesii]
MASAKVKEALEQAQAQPDPAVAYKTILSKIKTLSTPKTIADDLIAIADDILGRLSLGIVATRSAVGDLVATLQSLENHDLWIQVGRHVLDGIGSGTTTLTSSLLDHAATIRELIATAHEANEDFRDAATVLAEIPLDSSQRRVSDKNKVMIWIRIVRNYLEVDDSTNAEAYLNKLKNVMHTVDDPELNLHFKLSAARIQDSKRQFLAAAQSYHDISLSADIAEEERLHTLGMAIKCAILAPAGPPRSKALARLYRDERSAALEEFGMLEKMFLNRLLSPAEVDKFAQGLAPHQLAITQDGSTVLAKAVTEHNLLGASRLYSNISFDALGLLLGLGADKAEDTTAKMIEQGRLKGSIDQIDRIIRFESGDASGKEGSRRAEGLVHPAMRRWDNNVQAIAEDVERIIDALQSEFPKFVAAQVAAV